ncbi:MAG TPA: peptidase S10 [Thermoanaerobaculia bacterium]|jgi:carboxypeptidase C (cathepsin A)
MVRRALIFLLPASLLLAGPLPAEEEKPAEKKVEQPALEEKLATTQHSLTLAGERVDYAATAGTMVIRDAEGKPLASVFHVAYTRDGVDDPATRPVTFSFNGGPGAAALWVNLGAFGPKKVLADDEGMPYPPPGRLVDNPYSVLDVTDLVFIDPVETGLSRKAADVDRSRFHGLKADVETVGEVIRLWVTRNGRWASPKFIAGESYGTTRAAGLAFYLQDELGMYLNGVVMISTVLNWGNQDFHVGNDLPYLIHLPSYAAAAWYHGKLAPELSGDLRATLGEVERFALGDYALALHQGAALPAADRRAVAERVGRYTGLTAEFVERNDLRLVLRRFLKELLREEGKTVGRLDSRFTGYDRDSAGESPEFDPSSEAVAVGYVALMNDYIRRELEFETDLVYRPLAFEVFPWKWEDHENQFVNVAEVLRQAMTRNPFLHVLFTSGYYDFATPYFDTVYTVNHLGLPEELRGHVSIAFYEAGHMMYIRKQDHAKLKRDVADFIARATPAP